MNVDKAVLYDLQKPAIKLTMSRKNILVFLLVEDDTEFSTQNPFFVCNIFDEMILLSLTYL